MGRLEAALGVVGLLALLTTYIVITGWNPMPGILDWVSRVGTLSTPEPAWKTRLGGKPEYAVLTNRAVIVVSRGTVEARSASTGEEIWSREVPWVGVAGADSAAVVVAGRPGGGGFEVIDPETGAVRWEDGGALGVWTFRDMLLALTCPGGSGCVLAGHEPTGGRALWRTPMPGMGKVLAGVNHELLGTRDLTASTVDERVGRPADAPPALGFPMDRKVQVVDTATGKLLRAAESDGTTRVVVAGGRILHSKAERHEGQCRYTLTARDPGSGRQVWQKSGFDLRTSSGAGCEQRKDPLGGGGAIAAIRGDNREVILGARDGNELWVGEPGEKVLATDGLVGLIRTADRKKIKVIDLGNRATRWDMDVDQDAEASLSRHAALILDEDRVRAVEVGTGRVIIDAETGGEVIGIGSDGLILAAGRTIGLLPYGPVRAAG